MKLIIVYHVSLLCKDTSYYPRSTTILKPCIYD
nr:MAG TPA: hypothetical protein [Caudoviricetes sp.]